jgi:adenylylsulfate kinase-like enzyme
MVEKYPSISSQVCQQLMPRGFLMYPSLLAHLETGKSAIRKAQSVGKACVFIRGEAGSGKTAFAAKLAQESNFALVQTCFPEDLVGLTDADKCMHIRKVNVSTFCVSTSTLSLYRSSKGRTCRLRAASFSTISRNCSSFVRWGRCIRTRYCKLFLCF